MSTETKIGCLPRRSAVAAAVVIAIGLLAACGEDDVVDQAEQLTGDPVKIGLMVPVDSQTASLPAAVTAARVAERAVNAAGGIGGRPLEIVHCDDKDNPQEAGLCAARFKEDGVLAIVGSAGRQSAALYPVLEEMDTVNFGVAPNTPEDMSHERSYPLGPSLIGAINLAGMVDTSGPVALVGPDTPGAALTFGEIEKALAGKVEIERIATDPASTDFSRACLQLSQSGVEQAVLALVPAQNALFAQTCQRSGVSDELTYLVPGTNVDTALVESFSQAGVRSKVSLSFGVDPAAYPRRAEFESQIKEYADAVGGEADLWSDYAANSWLAVTLFAEILNNQPDLDGPGLKAYLDKQSRFETGLTQPLDFTKPGALAAFPRVSNSSTLPGEIADGEVRQTGNEWRSSVLAE